MTQHRDPLVKLYRRRRDALEAWLTMKHMLEAIRTVRLAPINELLDRQLEADRQRSIVAKLDRLIEQELQTRRQNGHV